jgi:excisionase family DNA binding protein
MARLFTMPETLGYLGVSRATAYRLIRAGRLPVVRIGRRVLFRQETLDTFIQNAECWPGEARHAGKSAAMLTEIMQVPSAGASEACGLLPAHATISTPGIEGPGHDLNGRLKGNGRGRAMKQGSRRQPSAADLEVRLQVGRAHAAQEAAWGRLWRRLLAAPPTEAGAGSCTEEDDTAAPVDETEAAGA